MSMTLEEAIEYFKMKVSAREAIGNDIGTDYEAYKIALTALRPVSREQVEKMWTGCEKCRDQANWPSWIEKGFVYCPKCGTPLTSWAWEKQVERLEALNDAVD